MRDRTGLRHPLDARGIVPAYHALCLLCPRRNRRGGGPSRKLVRNVCRNGIQRAVTEPVGVLPGLQIVVDHDKTFVWDGISVFSQTGLRKRSPLSERSVIRPPAGIEGLAAAMDPEPRLFGTPACARATQRGGGSNSRWAGRSARRTIA
jgi:hypothetical protein